MYYIISFTHTLRHKKYLVLWRPNNADYCFSKEKAGVYETPEKGYHDSDTQMPIKVEDAERLFQLVEYEKESWLHMIPNCKSTWDALGVRMTKYGLVRKKTNIHQHPHLLTPKA